MSISFWLEGDKDKHAINFCNPNACDLLRLLGRDKDAASRGGYWEP